MNVEIKCMCGNTVSTFTILDVKVIVIGGKSARGKPSFTLFMLFSTYLIQSALCEML